MKSYLARISGFFIACLLSLSVQAQQLNAQLTIFAPQTFTATTQNSSTFTNTNCKGAHFTIYISSYTSGSVTVHIQEYDYVSQQWMDLLVSPAISSAGSTPAVMKIYPGASIIANWSASDFLPYNWRVQLVGASTPSMTLSIGANCEY